jgi:hypothetical protein
MQCCTMITSTICSTSIVAFLRSGTARALSQGETEVDPRTAAANFRRAFAAEYGAVHPDWVESGWQVCSVRCSPVSHIVWYGKLRSWALCCSILDLGMLMRLRVITVLVCRMPQQQLPGSTSSCWCTCMRRATMTLQSSAVRR